MLPAPPAWASSASSCWGAADEPAIRFHHCRSRSRARPQTDYSWSSPLAPLGILTRQSRGLHSKFNDDTLRTRAVIGLCVPSMLHYRQALSLPAVTPLAAQGKSRNCRSNLVSPCSASTPVPSPPWAARRPAG
jgi:hypothetical protein